MLNDDLNFMVTNVNNVVKRTHVGNWLVENLTFEKNYVIVICLDGEASYHFNDNRILKVKKNDVILFEPGNVRTGKSSTHNPWSFISVNFDIEFLDGSNKILTDFIPSITDGNPESLKHKFVQLCSVWQGKYIAYNLKCRTLIQTILCDLITTSRVNKYSNSHYYEVEKVLKYLQENFTKPISPADVANMHSLSESHFRKLFREVTGVSIKEYLIWMRINNAKDLLSSSNINVTEAAMLSGFNDVFYFSTLFKKKFGFSPSKLIKQNDE